MLCTDIQYTDINEDIEFYFTGINMNATGNVLPSGSKVGLYNPSISQPWIQNQAKGNQQINSIAVGVVRNFADARNKVNQNW